MEILLLVSLFLTCFLFLLAITPNRGKLQAEEGEEKESVTFLGMLRKGNQAIRKMITRRGKKGKKRSKLEEQLSIAGVPMKPEEFLVFRWMFAIIIGGGLHLISSNAVLSIVGLFLGFLLPRLWLVQKQNKRIKEFNEGLPNMITSMVGSLRAGFSFLQSLQMVADESYGPIKEEVDFLLRSMQYGKSTEDALNEWKQRMPSEDLNLLIDAIMIQRQVGGNLAYLLDKIVDTIRERTKIENQIKTLTAQGRLSGLIISLLPVVLGFIIYFINPDYVTPLFTNIFGQIMLVIAVIGGIIGFLFIRKITTIEV